MPFGVAHTIILRVAKWAVGSFFDTVEVIHGENVPKTGPVIMYVLPVLPVLQIRLI